MCGSKRAWPLVTGTASRLVTSLRPTTLVVSRSCQVSHRTWIGPPGSLVWLPPQYFEAAYAHTKFPVIQLLSGSPGTPGTWLGGMQAPSLLENDVNEGVAHPFILISASINVDGRHDPDCSNLPGGPQGATSRATTGGAGSTAGRAVKSSPLAAITPIRVLTASRSVALLVY